MKCNKDGLDCEILKVNKQLREEIETLKIENAMLAAQNRWMATERQMQPYLTQQQRQYN